MKIYFLLLLFIILSSNSCLLTRQDIEEEFKESDEVEIRLEPENSYDLEKKKAPAVVPKSQRLIQTENSLRGLRGQLENFIKKQEDRLEKLEQTLSDLIKDLDSRFSALKEKNKKMSPENLFRQAEEFFKNKDWKSAIVSYQSYRENNKKNKLYKAATFQIGRCFYNLKMLKEAKMFFNEVVVSFPKSSEAKRAKKLLDGIKKSKSP